MRKAAPSLLFLLLLGATAAQAAESPRFEITPFLGYRFGGSFEDVEVQNGASLEIRDDNAYGLSLGYLFQPDAELEVIWSRQDTQLQTASFLGPVQNGFPLTIETFHVCGLYVFSDDVKWVRGFFSLGVGLTRFEPPAGFESENRLSFSAGLGMKFFPESHVGFRVQGRLISTYFSSGEEEVFCNSQNQCYISVSGSFVLQTELSAGVIFSF